MGQFETDPLPSVLFGAGLVPLGRGFAQRLGARSDDTLAACAGFIVVTGSLSALVHLAALAGALRLGWLRALGTLVLVCGAVELARRVRTLGGVLPLAARAVASLPGADRATLGLAATVLVLTCAAALGPPRISTRSIIISAFRSSG